jgi:hypothetical protein
MAGETEILNFLNDLSYENQDLTVERVTITMLVTFVIGLFIFLVYKQSFKGVLYTRSFNVGLVMTALITALIILPISSNILLALGMVGALSIVRFRTAIKDPIDIVFTFWAIAVGVGCGAGFFMVAIVGSLLIGLFLFIMNLADFKSSEPYLLVLHYQEKADPMVQKVLPDHKVRSRTVGAGEVELMLEVRMKPKETPQVDKYLKINGVKDAALVSYNGDYVS